jgi:Ca2+-transporting ATPase
MLQKPRPFATTFFNWKELTTSIIQGLAITMGTMFIYQYAVHSSFTEAATRTMIFTALVSANISLTLVNRSFYYSIITTLQYKNNLVPIIITITIGILALLLFVPVLTHFFLFQLLSVVQLAISVSVGFAVVIWYEVVKWIKRRSDNTPSPQ